MVIWSVPRMWQGLTVAVLASGPSMSAEVAARIRAACIPTVVVNTTFRLAPWAELLYAADHEWWKHTPGALQFEGLKVSVCPVAGVSDPHDGVHLLRETGKNGFDPDPSCIRTGRNSGYQAVHIAAQAGAKRILLCGMDFQNGHWHPEHEAPLRTTHPDFYDIFRAHFQTLVDPLVERGVEVLNCTPGSALRCFPFADLAEVLEGRSPAVTEEMVAAALREQQACAALAPEQRSPQVVVRRMLEAALEAEAS